MVDFDQAREKMVDACIAARGVRDPNVLAAMARVRRELFVPDEVREFAYDDVPLPIGNEQTISQPYVVAFMVEALMLEDGDTVLEVGAGSGYAAAVMAEIVDKVYAVERIEALAELAGANLDAAGYTNVQVLYADGTLGWMEHAPYDAILVSAGGPEVPRSLMRQLEVGGRLVIPIGADARSQALVRITRTGKDTFDREALADVHFVPLIGKEGWQSEVATMPSIQPRVIR